MFYFALLSVVFLLAYGVAVQSLLYPRAEDNWWDILYRIFKQPYLSMFGEFESHIEALDGMQLHCCRLHNKTPKHHNIIGVSIDLCINAVREGAVSTVTQHTNSTHHPREY